MQTDTENPAGEADEVEETLGTQTEIDELEGCRRRLKATVPGEKVREELDRNYRDLAQTVHIRGFRKGKVPRSLLESRYGEDVEKEVRESIVETSFSQVVEEKELKVFSRPEFEKVEYDGEGDLTYEAEFDVRPEFDIPEYKGVEVDGIASEFDPEEVDRELESLRERMGEPEHIDVDDATSDDFFEGSYRLLDGDAELRPSEDQVFRPTSKVIASIFVEDLEERVRVWLESIGVDSEGVPPLMIDVTLPASFSDELLRGRSARLEYTATGAFRRKLPELDDELAKTAGAESLAELRKQIGENLEQREESRVEKQLEDRIMESLAERTEMDVPEGLVSEQIRRWRVEREQELLQEGKAREEVEETLAREEAAGADGAKPEGEDGDAGEGVESRDAQVRANVKKYFILETIADQEKIFATEKDVADRVAAMADVYQIPHRRLLDELEQSGRLAELRQSLRHEKARAFLRKKASVTPVPGSASEKAPPTAENAEDESSEAGSGAPPVEEGTVKDTEAAEPSEDGEREGA